MLCKTRVLFAAACVLPMIVVAHASAATRFEPVPWKVPARLPDTAEALAPSAIRVDGWLGARIQANATNRLLTIDTEPLLAGFKKKPGIHPWIGEHVGKWMHAATLAWVYTGDDRLRAKLDATAAELISAQEPDGYLGTYVPDKRFGLYEGADWDVWSHKYNLIGLLTYYQYTGNEAALEACKKMGNLLIATFGPGKKSLLAAGTHVGMASTSVLEPMVILYRFTGEERYLEFARYIVKCWDEPNGPKIIQTLLSARQVNKTANSKAYEMLSNLVGLCELARATGDRALIEPVLVAWEDIVAKRLYLTGSASQGEHFHEDHHLPNHQRAAVAETCVTTTWIQLNLQLLRLTGQARFGNELEKTLYNHLAAAQKPAGDDWCYFTALEGRKPYDSGINCCHSSGPRGMSLAPSQAYLKGKEDGVDTLLVGTLETSAAKLELGGAVVSLAQNSRFPFEGRSEISLQLNRPARFTLKFRVPPWAKEFRARPASGNRATELKDGWLLIPAREWRNGDRVRLEFGLEPEIVSGTHGNEGLAALRYGPFVMAYDASRNPELPAALFVGLAPGEPKFNRLDSAPAVQARIRSPKLKQTQRALFVPFAEAGSLGGTYRVWLPGPDSPLRDNPSILAAGAEARSRQGNLEGSINDGDTNSVVVTFNGQPRDEDWFSIAVDEPVTVGRVVFVSGKIFHDGGWFDTSNGKPRVEIQTEKRGPWKKVGELTDYPSTTAKDCGPLSDNQPRAFTATFAPVKVFGVRVSGKPASGDNPSQAFASCAELQAFEK